MAERGESESPVPSESASQSHSSSASDSAASREGKGPAPPPPPRANPGAQQNANTGTVTQTSAAAAVSKKAAHSETGQPSSREGRTKAEKGKASAAGATGGPSTSAPHNRKRKETTEGAIAKSASSCSNLPTKSLSRNHNHLGRHGDTSNRARRNASRERTRHREEPPEHQVNVTLPNLSVTVQEPPTSTDSAKQKTPTKAPTNQNLAANGPAKLAQPVTTPSNIPNLSASVPAAATNQNAGHSAPTNQSSSVASNHGNQASGRSALRLSPNLDTSSSGSASESPPVRPKQPHPISSPQNQSSPTKPTKASNLAEEPWEGAASLASIGPPDPIPHNWQSTKGTVKERLTFMFNNEVLADVHFLVGRPPHRIPGHRFVLSVGSAVFDAMFNGAIAEEEEVELPDVEPAAFLALLRFLYSDEVHIGPETVMTTLYTAKKYAVPALERSCVDFLKRNLSADNAFMLLSQARLFDEPQLAALCLETIDRNTGEALAAEGFTDIDLDTLCVFLGRDTLGIRECKLFSALCRWADSECERRGLPLNSTSHRRVLDPALPSLRFPLMSVEEFALGPAQSGILSDREVVELFLYFTVSPKPNVRFSDTPRCCLTGKEQFVARFCQIESRWGYSGTSDRIRFTVNRRVFVVGFGLYGGIHGPADYSVNIQIIHTDTGKLCGVNDTTFSCDGSTSISRVMFKEPVEVAANVSYTACATLKGPDSYYGTKGLRKVTHESLASGKVTFQFTYAAGNNNGTSVEDGQIPEIIFYT